MGGLRKLAYISAKACLHYNPVFLAQRFTGKWFMAKRPIRVTYSVTYRVLAMAGNQVWQRFLLQVALLTDSARGGWIWSEALD